MSEYNPSILPSSNSSSPKAELIRAILFPSDESERERGENLGYEWAVGDATAEQVVRAYKATPDIEEFIESYVGDAYGPALQLGFLILGGDVDIDRRVGEVFWNKLGVDEPYECTSAFLEGFVQGAVRFVTESITDC